MKHILILPATLLALAACEYELDRPEEDKFVKCEHLNSGKKVAYNVHTIQNVSATHTTEGMLLRFTVPETGKALSMKEGDWMCEEGIGGWPEWADLKNESSP